MHIGGQSIFDEMSSDDLILAFFPCTRFEAIIPLQFRGEGIQQAKWSDEKKLVYSMRLHDELHQNYKTISKLVLVAINKGLKLVIENPYTQPHYLTEFWCIKPKLIDKDRRLNGDYMTKPTQYFFVNFEPFQNVIFEPIDYVEYRVVNRTKKTNGKDVKTVRSEIHPQYANRFIRKYLIDYEQDFSKLYEDTQ